MCECPNHFQKDPLKAFREMQLTVIPPRLLQQAVSHSGQEGDMWKLDIEHSLKMFGWQDDNTGHLLNCSQEVTWKCSQARRVAAWAKCYTSHT